MEIRIFKDIEKLNVEAAKYFIETIQKEKNPVLGLATGSTPIGMYKELIKSYQQGEISFVNTTTYNLDEYVGLDATHEQSYRYFMTENLFKHVNINPDNTHVPNGLGDSEKSCREYNQLLDDTQIDIQILGIGSNGHIAFNEPGTPFSAVTHVVNLTETSISDNSRFFESIDEVPKQAITMGLSNIMKAKKIILIALGENKAEAIRKLVQEDPNENTPCTILKNHPNVVILLDHAASSKLI